MCVLMVEAASFILQGEYLYVTEGNKQKTCNSL